MLLDPWRREPGGFLTQNEIDAAKTVRLEYFNAQEQQKFVWPPGFALARAYTDQLERSRSLAADRIAAVRSELARIERLSGAPRSDALRQLAAQLDADVPPSADAAKARLLAATLRELAGT